MRRLIIRIGLFSMKYIEVVVIKRTLDHFFCSIRKPHHHQKTDKPEDDSKDFALKQFQNRTTTRMEFGQNQHLGL